MHLRPRCIRIFFELLSKVRSSAVTQKYYLDFQDIHNSFSIRISGLSGGVLFYRLSRAERLPQREACKVQHIAFPHHYQGNIGFNTIQCTVLYNEHCTSPPTSRFPRPLRFPCGFFGGKSLGPREIAHLLKFKIVQPNTSLLSALYIFNICWGLLKLLELEVQGVFFDWSRPEKF